MRIQDEILENLFVRFVDFVSQKDKKPFTTFSKSVYIDQQENYKSRIYEEAKRYLGGKLSDYKWAEEDIGSGRIQKDVNKAIIISDNNLVFRGNSRSYLPERPDRGLENILFSFYKNEIKPQESFNHLLNEKIPYRLIAYLFFIKDKDQYLPICQERFDAIFKEIGLSDFKTSRNASWENYSTFIGIIKGVREFLKIKDTQPTLLDAHSFLWILGNQFEIEKESKAKKMPIKIFTENASRINAGSSENDHEETTVTEENEILSGEEDLTKLREHKRIERNRELATQAKRINGYVCKACGFSFEKKYGPLGYEFIEAHHLTPLGSLKGQKIQLDPAKDFTVLCSNCHRMIHKTQYVSDIEEFRRRYIEF